MKKFWINTLCLFLSLTLYAQDIFLSENTENQVFDAAVLGAWKLKNLENSFKKFNNNLYMGETEVTNQQYGYFLEDLLRQKQFDLLMRCKAEKTDWKALLPPDFKDFSEDRIFKYAGYPSMDIAPVQNLSHEGAEQFCKWLTEAYQKEDVNKRKWKKVLFRLPTESEWVLAAHGGKLSNALYPWENNDPQNSKGCFLSNYKTANEVTDGGIFIVRADAYYPNALGLYGMAGNVAEMVATKGIAKGGSWEDVPEQCTITAQKKYDNPSPAIGFRVLMEVIEN
jgi:formylglycine-generating enzyme required for sulfatase activity